MNQYAPTKTISIDEDVLDILRRMEWRSGGGQTHGIITEQLDRALYIKTNKVLENLGGKWNRKAKAHIFDYDPRPDLGIIVENGTIDIVKDGFYPTPRTIGVMMAEMADILPGMDVLEPSAGMGDLAQAIEQVEPRCYLYVIEIDNRRRDALSQAGYTVVDQDFFNHSVVYDRVVQNPPFERLQDIDHVLHAWDCLRDGGILVSVVSESAFFQNTRKAIDFRMWLHERECDIVTLDRGTFHESGTDVLARIIKIAKTQVAQLTLF